MVEKLRYTYIHVHIYIYIQIHTYIHMHTNKWLIPNKLTQKYKSKNMYKDILGIFTLKKTGINFKIENKFEKLEQITLN